MKIDREYFSGFASQLENGISGTAKQLRNAERKSENQKIRPEMCDHASHIAIAITNDNQPQLHATSALAKAAPSLPHVVSPLMTVDQNLMN